MAITFSSTHHIAAQLGDTGGTTGTFSSTGDDLLVIYIAYWIFPTTFTDSASNTLTHAGGTTYNSNSQEFLRCYYAASMNTSGTHSVTATGGAGSRISVCVASFAGAHTSPLDQINGAGAIFQTSFQPGSITPSENNCLVVFVGCHDDNAVDASVNIGTTIDNLEGNNDISMLHAYEIQTTATARNPTFTTDTESTRVIAEIVSFKAAAAAGGGPPPGNSTQFLTMTGVGT